jgi:glycosyltransferase involved in cell wall biosynthesis
VNLGFYSHVDAVVAGDGSVRLPSATGNFVSSLAEKAGGSMTLYLHGGTGTGIEDMTMGPPDVRAVDLGQRGSAPARFFRPRKYLKRFDPSRDGLDAVLIQGPSPLLPHLIAAAYPVPVGLLIWGDIASWRAQPQFPAWRNTAIRAWAKLYGLRQRWASRGLLAFVNDPHLSATVPGAILKDVTFTPVTQAMVADVEPSSDEWEPEKGHSEPVRLVYGGRIVRDKGVLECVRCVATLRYRGYNASLDLFGWTDPSDPVADELGSVARELGVADVVRIRDYVPSGPPLMRAFAECDVFVIPTYWDSLPRSMLEAMAVGLPVVASAVGGIDHHLRNEETALLIQPRNPDQVADAVERLICDSALRRKLASNGRAWSTAHTQDAESETIVAEIAALIAR